MNTIEEMERLGMGSLLDRENPSAGVTFRDLYSPQPTPAKRPEQRIAGRTVEAETTQQVNFQNMLDRLLREATRMKEDDPILQGIKALSKRPEETDLEYLQRNRKMTNEALEEHKRRQDYVQNELSQLKSDEGTKMNRKGENVSYLDSKGLLTGGIGHLMTPEEKEKYPVGSVIPAEVVDKWFMEDVAKHSAIVERLAPDAPPQIKQVLFNMAFNLGENRLKGFEKTLKAVSKGDWVEMAKEMKDSKWYREDVPNRARRLIERVEEFGATETNTSEG